MFFVTPKPSVVELMIVCLQKAREAVFHIKTTSSLLTVWCDTRWTRVNGNPHARSQRSFWQLCGCGRGFTAILPRLH